MSVLDSRVSIAGPGRAARAFARSWVHAGGRLQDVVARDIAGASRATEEIGGVPRTAGAGPFVCDILLLGVPDDAVAQVAQRLAPEVSCRFAFHLAGALSAQVLAPLTGAGASIGSLHPVRAFSGAAEEDWKGAFVAIEGEERAVRQGELLVEAIGAHGHRLAAEAKPLYHAAATLAAGGSLGLVSLAARAWASLGIAETDARGALAGLAGRAVEAAVDRDFSDVFTGPVARRDVGTVAAHRAALARRPEALAVYVALARETLSRTPGRGKEEEILAVLQAP